MRQGEAICVVILACLVAACVVAAESPKLPKGPYCVRVDGVGTVHVPFAQPSLDDVGSHRAGVRNALSLLGLHPKRLTMASLGDPILGIEGEIVCECATTERKDGQVTGCSGDCSDCEHCWVPDKGGRGGGHSGGGDGKPINKPIVE